MALLSLTPSTITTTQDLSGIIGGASPHLFTVGGIGYLVTKRNIPGNTADAHIVVYQSDATGLTWSLVANGGNTLATEFGVALMGTKIYIVDYKNDNPNFHLGIWTFDTVAVTLSGPAAANGPASLQSSSELTISPLNSGTDLVISFSVNNGGGTTNDFDVVKYTPGSDTWGTPVVLNSIASRGVAQIHDSGSDKTFVWYNKGGTKELHSITLDNTLTVQNTSAAIVTFTSSFPFIETWGIPCITSNAPGAVSSVAFPYYFQGVIKVIFENISTYATTIEVMDDGTDLGGSNVIQVYDLQDQPGWACLDFGGTLYCIFTVDNGDLDSASSQCFLMAKNRSSGSWGGLQTLFTSAVSNEMLCPFPSSWNVNGPVITVNVWDPTQNILTAPVTHLTSTILLPASASVPAVVSAPVFYKTSNVGRTGKSGIKQTLITIPEMNSFDDVRQALAKAINDLQLHIASQLPTIDHQGQQIKNVAPPTAADDVVTLKYLQSSIQATSK